MKLTSYALFAIGLAAGATRAAAEPIFLARQYPRCTTCHFSPTGGGLLTPYGRALSREELSSFGHGRGSPREHEFLFGLLGDGAGPVSLGIGLRPSRLETESAGFSSTRNLLMNAEIAAALRHESWTFYAQLGRQPRRSGTRVTSFEHWAAYRAGSGVGLRIGRFIPAYGIKLADHTVFTRSPLDLDNDDQVYALELSFTGDSHLLQLTAGPGFADSVEPVSRRAFTATGRWQFDLRPRVVLVTSGLYRAASDLEPRHGAAGAALGVAPSSRLTLWGQADARFREGEEGTGYTLLAEAAVELIRGAWLKLSPQLLTDYGDASSGIFRLNLALNLLPRTHWNVVLSYYRDRPRRGPGTSTTLLAQLHLYL